LIRTRERSPANSRAEPLIARPSPATSSCALVFPSGAIRASPVNVPPSAFGVSGSKLPSMVSARSLANFPLRLACACQSVRASSGSSVYALGCKPVIENSPATSPPS
jgi:hypothetical protein